MIRTVDVRIRVLRGGAQYSELYPIEGSAPQLRMDDSGGIPTALSGDFVINPAVDWLADELQPVLEIDGAETELGIYLPATVTETEDSTTKSLHVEAYDRCWLVRDNRTETLLYLAAGTNYVEAVRGLLVDCGIPLILSTPTTETLLTARQDWPVGTSYLDIVNQLLAEINYKALWFNNQGVAMVEPMATPTAAQISHTLDKDQITSLLLPQIQSESDIYSAPNVFICICSNADLSTPLVATVENNNPQSPLSIMRRGRRIVTVVNVDNIASQTALQAYATRLLFDSMTTGEVINVSTALLPGFGVDDVTALHYGDLAAICIERGWTMELKPGGTMTHKLERVVYNIETG